MTYVDTPFKFKKQRFEEETLIFYWTPGANDANCHLKKQREGNYKGECQLKGSDKKIEMQILRPETKYSDPDDAAKANDSWFYIGYISTSLSRMYSKPGIEAF